MHFGSRRHVSRAATSLFALRTAALALGLTALALPSTASAESKCGAPGAGTCLNSDTFWPSSGPSKFVGISGTQTVNESELAIGVVTSFQSRPVVLTTASPGPSGAGTDSYAVDNQFTANFLWQYGITKRLAFDLALPITLGQTGDGLSALTGGKDIKFTAMRDLRYGLAFAIVPRERVDSETSRANKGPGHNYAVTARFGMTAPIGDKTELAGERTAVFMPQIAADYRRGPVFLGAELGARIRPTTEVLGARIGTQLSGGLGVGIDLLPRELLSAQLEARALYNVPEQADVVLSGGNVVSTPNGKYLFPAEWMLSARTAPLPSGDLAITFGGGGGLTADTVTVPRFRFVLGLVYSPEGRDSDGDGILDRVDACPRIPARGERRDGCDHGDPEAQPQPKRDPQSL